MKIYKDFYTSTDVVQIARNLIGKYLFVKSEGIVCGGYITESEAYQGPTDRASHAYNNRRTNRTEVMFYEGGRTYVYLCYGIHSMLNIVTGPKDIPHAVLIRGFMPTTGLEAIKKRIGVNNPSAKNFNGPGKLTKALGINAVHNNLDLSGNEIWLEDRGLNLKGKKIIAGPRIGVDYAKEDALLPYRFVLK